MKKAIRHALAAVTSTTLLAPAGAWASYVCISGINNSGNVRTEGCVTSDTGYNGTGKAQQTGPWGVSGADADEYRGGTWSTNQSADLSTGVMRSSLLYASGPYDLNEYQLGTYLDIHDRITFAGTGQAVFTMHLTGAFTGSAHRDYDNSMDTSLDLYSDSRGDVLGRINLDHDGATAGLATMRSGSTCGADYYNLGPVRCTVNSLLADQIDIELSVTVNNITDGEMFSFFSTLNVQAYGPRMGGSDFGNTARLGVRLSDGLSFTSESGVMLTRVPGATPPTNNGVPEPASLGLVMAALGLAGATRRRAAATA